MKQARCNCTVVHALLQKQVDSAASDHHLLLHVFRKRKNFTLQSSRANPSRSQTRWLRRHSLSGEVVGSSQQTDLAQEGELACRREA